MTPPPGSDGPCPVGATAGAARPRSAPTAGATYRPDVDDVTIEGQLAVRLLRLLDEVSDAGLLAYYDEDDLDVAAEAEHLGRRLLERVPRPFAVGDRVVLEERPTDAVGVVVHQVLFTDGWEVHVDWPQGGVAVSRAATLRQADQAR